LAERGAIVVLLWRSPDKLKAKVELVRVALSEAQIDYQNIEIDMLAIDFSDMESVRLAVGEAMNPFPMINGLVLSVGAFIQNGPNILPSGHEMMFATNVMGPFLFTQLLLKRMQESDGLVLLVIALFDKKINWDDLESIRYHRAMTAFNRQFSREISTDIQRVALRKLRMLNRTMMLQDLKIPPGNRLEELKGKRKGQHSIRINDQWRVCFLWKENNSYEVEIVDHH
jgi:proteic killer suppression protein